MTNDGSGAPWLTRILEALREQAGIWEEFGRWRSAAPIDVDRFRLAAELVGRDGAPALLHDLWSTGRVTPDVLRAVLPSVWSDAEFPERLLPRRLWLGWFELAAFPRPPGTLTLYRGAVPRFARGMSWTTSATRAAWFANRWGFELQLDPFIVEWTDAELAAERRRLALALERAGETGERRAFIYEATVPPDAVLAVLSDFEPEIRSEDEVVVSPALLPRPVRRMKNQ